MLKPSLVLQTRKDPRKVAEENFLIFQCNLKILTEHHGTLFKIVYTTPTSRFLYYHLKMLAVKKFLCSTRQIFWKVHSSTDLVTHNLMPCLQFTIGGRSRNCDGLLSLVLPAEEAL